MILVTLPLACLVHEKKKIKSFVVPMGMENYKRKLKIHFNSHVFYISLFDNGAKVIQKLVINAEKQ